MITNTPSLSQYSFPDVVNNYILISFFLLNCLQAPNIFYIKIYWIIENISIK